MLFPLDLSDSSSSSGIAETEKSEQFCTKLFACDQVHEEVIGVDGIDERSVQANAT